MMSSGVKASELIEMLKTMILRHGDKQVFTGGTDYPEGVGGVSYTAPTKGDGYIPGDSFTIF